MKRIKFLFTLLCLAAVSVGCIPGRTSTPVVASPTIEQTQPPVTATPRPSTETILEQLGGSPCPDSDFTCVKLSVPLDHFAPAGGKTIEVVFAVLPATGERKGMFVTANGGPGASGLQAADSYTSTFDAGITQHFDIVFFDQRGVGASGGLQCAQAAATYYMTDADTTTPAGEAALASASQTFAQDCVREMGNPEMLPYLGTAQAIEDLESFRQAMQDDKFWLYGESYGTQFSQTYAAAHPDHLAGLILDGTVDLTLSGTDFLAEQAAAFDNTLQMALQACNDDSACANEMGGNATAAYDNLASLLRTSPQQFDFPLPSGGMAQRTFTLGNLESAASGYLYSERTRMIFLRALAAYARDGNLAPMARVLYDALSIDPETLAGVPDPTYSDAVYYSVECQDYAYFNGSPEQRAEAYLRAGDPVDASLKHFSSIFYGDLPCVFWPKASQKQTRPPYLRAAGVPTLVLGATADPATPLANGVSVYHHLADGYMVTETGGPHVIFNWGASSACPDALVNAFLEDGKLPDQRETTCQGEVTRTYVLLAPTNASAFATPLEALDSADTEIYYLPEYYYWDVKTPTSVGCPFGGMLSFEPSDVGEAFTLTACAFSQGFVMTGTGTNNYDENVLRLDVAVSGLADGHLVYTRDGNGQRHVTGEYAGKAIDLSK
jgi:pimeloyl-ACP methyl ester carboxylesterase